MDLAGKVNPSRFPVSLFAVWANLMNTEISIQSDGFFINGRPTYEGAEWRGKKIEGLLFNSRMIQALFDDECPDIRELWRYPDTGAWDPDRNTDEFCAQLPEYRRHGLLAVTVGLQGGGSIYCPAVYDRYVNSAYTPDGALKPAYFQRLRRILQAADAAGMVVIVNYFYWKQARRFESQTIVPSLVEKTTDFLLRTGFRNILIDIANESAGWWKYPVLEPENMHRLLDIAKSTTCQGRRLLVSSSTGGLDQIAPGPWLDAEDFSLPHGNGCNPDTLREKLRRWRHTPEYRKRPRPLLINEDSVFLDNLDAAVGEYASWGFYCQGYGSGYAERIRWDSQPREADYANLSGFQTVPINWAINDPHKKAFFQRLREITAGSAQCS